LRAIALGNGSMKNLLQNISSRRHQSYGRWASHVHMNIHAMANNIYTLKNNNEWRNIQNIGSMNLSHDFQMLLNWYEGWA
jgi:hypothetical protein